VADKVQGKSDKSSRCANRGIFTKANKKTSNKLVFVCSAYVQWREGWTFLMINPEHLIKASALKLSLSSSVFTVYGERPVFLMLTQLHVGMQLMAFE